MPRIRRTPPLAIAKLAQRLGYALLVREQAGHLGLSQLMAFTVERIVLPTQRTEGSGPC